MTTLNVNCGEFSERTTHTFDGIQTWRHVGWLGQSGTVYQLDDDAVYDEPGGFMPLWVLAHNEEPPDAPGEPT